MSGLIYAVIVVMWLAFLVPMWLRRHDDAIEAKSVDRFSTAMKVLARRTSAAEPTAVGEQGVDRPGDSPDGWLASIRRGARPGLLADLRSRAARSAVVVERRSVSLAVRRQRVLAALVALTLVVAGLASVAVFPWLALAPIGAVLMAYVVHLRLQARRATELARSRARVRSLGPGRDRVRATDDPVHTVKITSPPSRRPDWSAISSPAAATRELEPASGADDSAIAARGGAGAAGHASSTQIPDGFAGPRVGWDPIPVPAPTYVSAARVPRAVRSIDLSTEGAWTSGRLVADAKAAAAAAVEPAPDADDEPARTQRAVGS